MIGLERDGLQFVAEFSYAGRKPQPPAAIVLGFFTAPLSSIAGHELTVIADRKRLPLGKMALQYEDFYQHTGCANLYLETGVLVPRDTFLRIVQAKTIEVWANGKVLPLVEHFVALRALSRMMQR